MNQQKSPSTGKKLLEQAVMRGPTRVKRKESEKPFEAQNDLILTKI